VKVGLYSVAGCDNTDVGNHTYHHGACVHDEDLVRIHDCVEPVSYCQNRTVLEFPSYCLLYKGISPATGHRTHLESKHEKA
jgi:hypothetical protein